MENHLDYMYVAKAWPRIWTWHLQKKKPNNIGNNNKQTKLWLGELECSPTNYLFNLKYMYK